MKKLFFIAIIASASTGFSQNYYYTTEGEKVEADIVSQSLSSITIDDGTKKKLVLKTDKVSAFVIDGDSTTLLKETGMPLGPKEFFMKVVVHGKISYYTNTYIRNMDQEFVYLLGKEGKYESIDNFNKGWKDFFKDNTSIYNKINALKPKEYYYNADKLIELINEYNEEEK